MKKNGRTGTLVALAALCVAAVIGSAFGEGKPIKQLFQESVKLFEAQQYEQALKGFDAIVKKAPRYVHARSYAAKCRQAIVAGTKPTKSLESKLSELILPSVEFVDTDLGSVLDYLSQRSEELSGGKVVANFIYKGTDEQRRSIQVSLKLRQVPLTRVIEYVGQLTETRFTYDEFAVVARPTTKAPGSANLTPPSSSTDVVSKKDDISSKFD